MIGELLVTGFVLLPLGLAFLVTALVSVFVTSWAALLIILAIAEVGVFLVFKKYLRKYRGQTNLYTNAEGMVGQECVVLEPISIEKGGYVKLYGDHWPARTTSQRTFQKGDRVVITKVEGNKVFVEPLNEARE
jgi:membrane protein implicated in regulation of membrane protease activity